MILDRAPDDEPLIPGDRTKIRLEMMRKKEIKKRKKEDRECQPYTGAQTLRDEEIKQEEPTRGDLEYRTGLRNSGSIDEDIQEVSFCEPPNRTRVYREQNNLKKTEWNIAENPSSRKMNDSVAGALNANKSQTYFAVSNGKLKNLRPKECNITPIETENEHLKVVLQSMSTGKLGKVMTRMSEGDATTTNIYKSAPRDSDKKSSPNTNICMPKQDDWHGSKSMITLGVPCKTPSLQSQSGSRVCMEVSGVKKTSVKPDYITNTNTEKTSLGNAELNLGHTTRFLPRQAEAFIDSGKNTHMGNSKLGGTTRFSSRQVSECPYFHAGGTLKNCSYCRGPSGPHLITTKTDVKVQTSR